MKEVDAIWARLARRRLATRKEEKDLETRGAKRFEAGPCSLALLQRQVVVIPGSLQHSEPILNYNSFDL